MNKELQKMTREWMQLERKTFEQRRIAEQFYDDKLMGLIEKAFIQNNRKRVTEKVEYMVVSVGTSYEPIVLNLKLLQPTKILFLYTEKSEATLNKIIRYCDLDAADYEKRRISEVDPLDVYREIRRIFLFWNQPDRMYIDFTGGTKSMSAAAALAGAMISVQLVYVATDDYLVEFRKPNPGSEKLLYIDNPLSVFGDLEIDKAFELFDKANFAGAIEKLAVLKEQIPEPNTRQQMNFVYLLSKSYEAWDSLNFIPAWEYMCTLVREIDRDKRLHNDFLLMDFADAFRTQRDILKQMKVIPELIKTKKQMEILEKKETIAALMFSIQQNARTRVSQDKLDMATLLFYRLLEMIEQRRLAMYNLYVSNMDYSHMKYNLTQTPELEKLSMDERTKWLEQEVGKIKSDLFHKFSPYLQDQVTLLEGFILLTALRDPIMEMKGKGSMELLKMMRSRVSLRNNSIFAHGLGPVGEEDFQRFRSFVEDMFRRFCDIEKLDYERYTNNTRWISPRQYVNYSAKGV